MLAAARLARRPPGGRSVLVDRQWLLSRLEELQAGAEFTFEVRRKQRLVESLEEVRRCHAASKVAIPVSCGAWDVRDLDRWIEDNKLHDYRELCHVLGCSPEPSISVVAPV